jgi:phosphoribosylformimino-5-aminoimidazole carboxamide ribotide isomerase
LLIVPVIDLKSGVVVHARGGDRASYRPVNSRLCPGSAPVEVIGAFLRLHPFETVYAADLDAIEGEGNNRAALAAIRAAFPALKLWVDAGIGSFAAFAEWRGLDLGAAVVGSESLASLSEWRKIAAHGAEGLVLSLDFKGARFFGPSAIARDPALWPRDVIVMSLARVGAKAGPDYLRLQSLRRRDDTHRLFAAGGVRNAADLRRLSELGIAGAMVASALHDGRLTKESIVRAQSFSAR